MLNIQSVLCCICRSKLEERNMSCPKMNVVLETNQAYALSKETALMLRVPAINYVGGRVPVAIAADCLEDGATKCFEVVDNSIALLDVVQYFESAARSFQALCLKCSTYSIVKNVSLIKIPARQELVCSEY